LDIREALKELERMHATETVRRESIIAWYRFYSRKLPIMHPERSEVDLIRTVALWMKLTDQGGSPGFPYDYKSELNFAPIDPLEALDAKPNWLFWLGVLSMGGGLVGVFFKWTVGLTFLIAGVGTWIVAYKLQGGATNRDLILYDREARRALDWASKGGLALRGVAPSEPGRVDR
jgi:hypothetical protein